MKKNNNIQDEQIKRLLSDTKVSANENLKYRIMQQIKTESVLSKQNANRNSLRIGSLLSIFGGVYVLFVLLAVIIYISYGFETLISLPVLGSFVFISSIGSVLWMILVFDEKRRVNYRSKVK